MKIIKYILIGVAVIISAVITVNLFAPAKLSVEKSIVIDAPASVIYEEVADFHNWAKWDPWKKADSNMISEFSGEESGLGAIFEWQSETQGNGKQEIIEVKKNEYLKTSLAFSDWDGLNYSDWKFEESESGTKVTWTMDGAENPFMFKFFNLIMKPMVSENYEQGLQSLKEIAESKTSDMTEEEIVIQEVSQDSSVNVNDTIESVEE